MRVVVQRVLESDVSVNGNVIGKIGPGLCIFFGVKSGDSYDEMDWLINKIVNLRIFSDEHGKMNKSVQDIDGEILVISQFTLYASTRKGNRPSFIEAEKPERAEKFYNSFVENLQKKLGKTIQTGEFGGDMKINIVNDGPVTILIDTELKW